MIKKNKILIIITSIITILPMVAGIVLWNSLPDTMATHFGSSGEANGWSTKAMAVFGIPLIILALHLICVFCVYLDPKRRNISEKMYSLLLCICPFCSVISGFLIYYQNLGKSVDIMLAVSFILGVIFVVIGNYLPKSRLNYSVGYKLPWTLADENNWNKTHRLAGWLWVAGGLVMLVNMYLKSMWLIIIVIAVASVIPIAYSVIYYLRYGKRSKG